MQHFLSLWANPALLSILLLCILCVRKVNVLLAILFCTIFAGLFSGMGLKDVMDVFIAGMGDNSETALSYILLGTFAATMSYSGFTQIISSKITKCVAGKRGLLLFILTLIAMSSQNIIPIHIAFIPILIPPLLSTMNALKIDRRAVACVLAFGLKMPYIVIPAGFGLIFQNLITDNMVQNGLDIAKGQIWKSTLILGFGMLAGLLTAVLISYRKPRSYNDKAITCAAPESSNFTSKHCFVLLAIISTFIVQILTQSLPLGALLGLGIMFSFGVISKDKMDHMMNEGIYLMGYIAFIMLVAAGFAAVLKKTGAIETFVNTLIPLLPSNIFLISFIILLIGLFITIGIGTSFGTIPILAVLFIPICVHMGFNTRQITLLLAAAAALGDAGSPASDTTLGPSAGLNADGQHDHIFDTCIPTFLHYNIALIIFALLGIYVFA